MQDFLAALGATPLSVLVPYLTCTIAGATALLLALPAPSGASPQAYQTFYGLVHVLANLKSPAPIAPAPAPVTVTVAASAPAAPAVASAIALALMFGLTACSATQVATMAQVNTAICQDAAALQPVLVPLGATIATAVDPAAAVAIAGAVKLDTAAIHPALQAACPVGTSLIGAMAMPSATATPTAITPAVVVVPATN